MGKNENIYMFSPYIGLPRLICSQPNWVIPEYSSFNQRRVNDLNAFPMLTEYCAIDSFTISKHSPNIWDCARGLSVTCEKWWKFPLVTSAHNALGLIWSQPLNQPITKGWCQPIGGHFSYATDNPTATKLGLCSSLTLPVGLVILGNRVSAATLWAIWDFTETSFNLNPCGTEFILGTCKYLDIFYHVSLLGLVRYLQFCLMDDDHPYMGHSQYRGCWWLGDRRSCGISSYGTVFLCLENIVFSTRQIENHHSR